MTSRISTIVDQMSTCELSPIETNYSKAQLLEDCPELKFDPSNKGRDNLWHDLQKKASHTGCKNILIFQIPDVEPMVEKEYVFLLDVRLNIVKILRCNRADRNKDRNKGLILAVLKRLYGRNFSTGKNTPDYVRRVVVILEKLSGVKAVTKRKPEEQPRLFEDWDALDDFDVNILPPIDPPADQSPAKKQKTVSEPTAAAAVAAVPLVEADVTSQASERPRTDLYAVNQEEQCEPVSLPEDALELDCFELDLLDNDELLDECLNDFIAR